MKGLEVAEAMVLWVGDETPKWELEPQGEDGKSGLRLLEYKSKPEIKKMKKD